MLAGRVVPSHAFVHVVDWYRYFGCWNAREDGDVIHVISTGCCLPKNIGEIKACVEKERVIIEAAKSPFL